MTSVMPNFIEWNTGAYLSRKAVNEGTELDLEERENFYFGKQAHRGESREKLKGARERADLVASDLKDRNESAAAEEFAEEAAIGLLSVAKREFKDYTPLCPSRRGLEEVLFSTIRCHRESAELLTKEWLLDRNRPAKRGGRDLRAHRRSGLLELVIILITQRRPIQQVLMQSVTSSLSETAADKRAASPLGCESHRSRARSREEEHTTG
ncbi:hypothetical protein VNO77_46946 [Canavalia gladiata]|uniref:Uncharacterized protein n=1 Tax=Canavalia gladiata TaxID=3824 RepID=A0AAN9JG18_CANGL